MPKPVIKVENLTKEYRLGIINNGMLFKDMQSWWARLRGKEDPHSKLTSTSSPLSLSKRGAGGELLYALKDVSFEVKQGEVLGIIGANGAGKSTLLKILSRVTAPTSGTIKIKGRIGSLLEVGTGFHPELTGRENIYLNGAILGMKKWEIDKKLDEIIDFSGVEKFIDTPVKRYSSGMYVRLAFAVAAHLDPEILVVDEVLAVGDAEFQKKCLGKMGDVAEKEGRTVLFVSHNMAAVKELTKICVMLKRGVVLAIDETSQVVERYIQNVYENTNNAKWVAFKECDEAACIKSICIKNSKGEQVNRIQFGETFKFEVEYQVKKCIVGSVLAINIHSADSSHIASFEDIDSLPQFLEKREPGEYVERLIIKDNTLNCGTYFVRVGIGIPRKKNFQNINAFSFTVINYNNYNVYDHRKGFFILRNKWEMNNT